MADNEIQDNSHNNGRVFFSLMEKVGSEGKYQYLTVVIMCIISYLTGGLMLILPYLFYQDPYVCPSQSSTQCLEFVCTLPL